MTPTKKTKVSKVLNAYKNAIKNIREEKSMDFCYLTEENKLKATGVITNTSNSAIIPSPWFVEGQFYYENESGNTFIITGDSYRITNTLQAGISQNWELEISVEDASGYDNFYVSDLRAYVNQ